MALADAASARQDVESLLPRHLSPRRREGIAQVIKAALLQLAEAHPQIVRNFIRRPSESERRRYHELETRRDAAAHQLGLDATLIASRAVLGDLARDWDKHAPELMNWQRQLLQP